MFQDNRKQASFLTFEAWLADFLNFQNENHNQKEVEIPYADITWGIKKWLLTKSSLTIPRKKLMNIVSH